MKLTPEETLELRDAVRKLPYFSRDDIVKERRERLYPRFVALKRVLENDKVADRTRLNKKNITGLWYLAGMYFEERSPQLLMRSTVEPCTMDRLYLHAEIFDFVFQDVIWDYDALIGGDSELIEEVRAGRVFTIYDEERI